MASAAYQRWASQTYCLPQVTFSALYPSDTTNVSYMMFVDDATWTDRGFNPNTAGLTYHRVFFDGTVAHGRTWYHFKVDELGLVARLRVQRQCTQPREMCKIAICR